MICVVALLGGVPATENPPQDEAKPKATTGDKWDASKADPAERESKRTEIWPHNYTPSASVTWVKDVVYGSPGGRDLDLDIIMRKEQPKAPRPAIVFIHGGSWKHGDKQQFRRQAARLADRYDIFGACIFYRLSGEAQFPAALHDCKCAVRWVRSVAEKHNIDTNRIAVCGGSAGGHLSSMMAVSGGVKKYEGDGGHAKFSSDVQLAILFNGEFDMFDLLKKGSLIGAMNQFFGGSFDEVPEVYRECSSVLRVHKDCPPMLFLHGTRDSCVSHEQSVAMVKRLKELNIPTKVELYEGRPHAWFNKPADLEITMDRVEPFLDKHFSVERIKGSQ